MPVMATPGKAGEAKSKTYVETVNVPNIGNTESVFCYRLKTLLIALRGGTLTLSVAITVCWEACHFMNGGSGLG